MIYCHMLGAIITVPKIAITIGNSLLKWLDDLAIIEYFSKQAQRADFPLTLVLSDPKFPKKSWAKISQIRTLL